MIQYILISLCMIDFLFIFYLFIIMKKIINKTKPIEPKVLKAVPVRKKESKKNKRKKRVFVTDAQREEIIRLSKLGRSGASISREFNVSNSQVCRIIRNNRRK